MTKFYNLPLQIKIISIYIFANLLILIVNIFLIMGINRMTLDMGMVYQDNRHLNELSNSLMDVQQCMTNYLNVKTSDSLEEYYKKAQKFEELYEDLNDEVTDISFHRMERNIKNMSRTYMDEVTQTIEAKRGRNVEKYRTHYENATQIYDYIFSYIRSLNIEQFASNSRHYNRLSKSFGVFETVSVSAMCLLMVINIFIITNLVRMIIKPLRMLADSANEVADGNFDVKLPEVVIHDDIGIVISAFDKMLFSIRQYIDKLKESMEKERYMQEKELMMETHLKDAQLKYLQAQINPHFLFNTLNAGVQLAMMEEADRTYEYVQTVADFFRYNVRKQESLVTLGEEIELVDNYIKILNVRFSGDIHYEKKVDDSLLQTQMPSMILQPIVENAVNHGIREMGDKGKITLFVYEDESDVCVSVKDNGKGMSPEDAEMILNGKWKCKENQYDNNGIGMDNVISRLQLFAEKKDVIDIISSKGNGCEIIVRLPFISQK